MDSIYKKTITAFVIFATAFWPVPSSGQSSVIDNLQKVMVSVVGIKAEVGGVFGSPKSAFRDSRTGRIFITQKVQAAKFTRVGAGIIIDASGIIATNAHTVKQASRVTVTLEDGSAFEAKILKLIEEEDVSFLKIDCTSPLKPIRFVSSDNIQIGSRVFNIGASEELKNTISEGVVRGIGKSSKNRNKEFVDLIQTSFNMYKGDSGGPLLDENGDFLGLILGTNTRISHTSYAIPSSKILKLSEDIRSAGV